MTNYDLICTLLVYSLVTLLDKYWLASPCLGNATFSIDHFYPGYKMQGWYHYDQSNTLKLKNDGIFACFVFSPWIALHHTDYKMEPFCSWCVRSSSLWWTTVERNNPVSCCQRYFYTVGIPWVWKWMKYDCWIAFNCSSIGISIQAKMEPVTNIENLFFMY